MTRTDWHTHCLPGIDDGAGDVAVSLEMLAETRRQGVDTVMATPHFYAATEEVTEFLRRRQESVESLQPLLTQEHPRIVLGAEVLVRRGIAALDLRPLCIEGTDCLLLELPFMPPPQWLYEELEKVVFGQRVRPIFAHLDRYMTYYSAEQIAMLTDLPDAIFQLNGEVFLHRATFRYLRRWLPKEPPLLLGSDMHNMGSRPPVLKDACRRLERSREGRTWLANMEETTASLLGDE